MLLLTILCSETGRKWLWSLALGVTALSAREHALYRWACRDCAGTPPCDDLYHSLGAQELTYREGVLDRRRGTRPGRV